MASPRTIARLEAQIQRRVAHCLQFELADPRASFVTVLRVELSRDLAHARVFYSVLGDASEQSRTQHMLEQASGFVQRQLGRVLHTRTIPRLRWVYDDSVAEAARMDRLIREARERDRRLRGESPGGAPEGPDEAREEPHPGASLEGGGEGQG